MVSTTPQTKLGLPDDVCSAITPVFVRPHIRESAASDAFGLEGK